MLAISPRRGAARRLLTAVPLALVLLAVLAAAAQAAPSITLTPGGDSEVLYGDQATVKLTAFNPSGQPKGYNLSFRAVLPTGVSYVPGSGPAGVPATVLNNQPAAGQTTVIFQNVSDLSANSSYDLTFKVSHNPAQVAVGSTFTVQGFAYVNTDARTVPQFDPTTGAANPAYYTGTATASQSIKTLPFRVTRIAPDDQLRGAHDFQYRTQIKIENNKVAPTTSISLTDYAPAGVEVLACGTGDHTTSAPTSGSSSEYSGSGPLNPGNAPTLTNCVAPNDVTTVSADPDGPGGVASGIYTRQTWSNLGTLATGATLTLDFATAIPIRENTLTWSGATPSGASGNQAANLDNNSGSETYDEQALTAFTTATGQYNGTTGASASDTQTTVAEDLTLSKSASSSSIAIGSQTTWTLKASASEYRWVDNTVITDTVPDGLCPLGATNYEDATDQQTDCNSISGSDPYDTVVEHADGTYTVTFDPLPRIAPSGSQQVQLVTRTRSHYQQNFVDDTDVLANDSWTNNATVSGDDFVICAGGSSATDCAGGTKISHDEADGQPDLDAASASQTADGPTLDKQVAVSGTDCDAATYSNSMQHYGPGDRVCWKLRMDFPAGTPTGNVTLTDFIPIGHTYEGGSFHVTSNNTVPIDSTDFSQAGLINATLGNSGITGQADVFEAVMSTIVNQQATPAFPGQLTQNLLKASTTNTPTTSFPLRSDADVTIDAPVVALDKSATPTNPVPGQVVSYKVHLDNTGQRTATNVEVWDNLPTGITCADVTSLGSASCSSGRMTWTVSSLAAGAGTDLNYQVTIPPTGAGHSYVNTAGVRHYQSQTNLGGTVDYYPQSNIDPSVAAQENAAPAKDTQTVTTPGIAVSKSRTTEVTESGNTAAQATIGEQITYTVSFTVKAHTRLYGTAHLDDPLNTRQTLVPGSLTATRNSGALPGGVTASEVGNGITLTFPADYEPTADEAYQLTYKAQVDDESPNVRGAAVTNTATLSYQSDPGVNKTASSSTSTTIVEPNINTTKSVDDADRIVDPGQEVAFTVTAINASAANVSTAHQVSLTDTVPAGLTPLASPGGAAATDGGTVGPDGGTWHASTRTITWPDVATISPGANAVRHYSAKVDDPAVSQAQLTNSFRAATSSLGSPEETGGERSDPTAIAGYAKTAQVTLDILGMSLTKDMSPSTRTVGEVVTGTLTVTVPANVAQVDAYVTDLLPDGLVFVSYDSATCISGCGPAITPATLPTQNAGAGRTRLGWWLGDIAAHTSARILELKYRARVAATYPGAGGNVDAGDTLVNSAQWHVNRNDTISGQPASIPASANVDSTPATDTVTVTEPQLTLDKDVSGDPDDDDARTAQPGDSFTYTIRVTNTGDHDAYDATVTDTPDSDLTNVVPIGGSSFVTDGWTAGDPDMTWVIPGPIAPGDTATLTYTADLVPSAQLTPASTVVNTADVTSFWGVAQATRTANPTYEYREYTNVPSDTVTIDVDTPQVTIDKVATGGPAATVGASYGWKVTLHNSASAATAHHADLTDTLPPNWRYDANSARINGTPVEPTVTPAPGGDQLRWDDAAVSLAPGADAVITYTATPRLAAVLTPGTGSPHVNSATVSGVEDGSGATADGDGSYSDVSDTAQTSLTVPSVDLGLDKVTTTAPVAGGPVAWRITVTNHGPDDSPTVRVADTLPAGVTLGQAQPSQGTCDVSGAPAIACSLGELDNGDTATIDITATVDDPAGAGGTLANTATVSDPAITDANPPNDTDSTSDPILERAGLTLDKELLDPLVTDRQARWQLRVANAGPSVARTVQISDPLPTGVTFVSADPGCSEAGGVVTCAVGDLAVGQVATRTVTTTVDVSDGVVQNTATATSPTPAPGGGPNSASDTASGPVTRPDLAIQQFVEGSASQGSTVNYVFAVNNAGSATTYAPTTVTATFPDGLVPLNASGDGWSCQVSGQTVTCTRPDNIAPGASFAAIRVGTRVDAPPGTLLTVLARVATAGDIVPPNDTSQTAIKADVAATPSCATGGKVVVDPTRMWAGARYKVSGHVVAADGRVVPGQAVRVLQSGRKALSLRTAANGTFSFVTRPASGSTRIRVQAPGCDGVKATIAARKAPSCRSITVTPASLKARKATRVKVRLSVGGHGLGMATVHLRGAGLTKTVRTDALGRATLRVTAKRAGILSVNAKQVAQCTRRVGVVAGATARQLTG
jgi:large repetitive protein